MKKLRTQRGHARLGFPKKKFGGFSLIELLVTIGIFSVITGVVLANYRSFNKNSDFANTIENVYFALREAQVYGAGGKTAGITACGTPASSFNCAYGVRFSVGSVSYDFFVDANENRMMDTGEQIQTQSLGVDTSVTSVTCITSSGSVACPASGASVTFKRPSPDAFIAERSGQENSIDRVVVAITKGTKTANVAISSTGQISIQ